MSCRNLEEVVPCISDVLPPFVEVNDITEPFGPNRCNIVVTVSDDNTELGDGCIGNPTFVSRVYTITDDVDNQLECAQVFIIQNTEAPVLVEPVEDGSVVDCTTDLTIEPDAPIFEDTCGEEVIPVASCCFRVLPDNTTFYDRVWTATDSCDNVETETQENPVSFECENDLTF